MGFAPATKKLVERVYQISIPIILLFICYVLLKQGKQVEATLILIIGLAAAVYYWIKFFKITTNTKKVWPPVINTCPDYLTQVNPSITGDNKTVCMDFVGIALPKSKAPILRADPNNIPTVSTQNYLEYVFTVPKEDTTEEQAVTLCNQVRMRGLTWAHVCD